MKKIILGVVFGAAMIGSIGCGTATCLVGAGAILGAEAIIHKDDIKGYVADTTSRLAAGIKEMQAPRAYNNPLGAAQGNLPFTAEVQADGSVKLVPLQTREPIKGRSPEQILADIAEQFAPKAK
jgi:Tfp pilus assembly protein PilP